MPGPYRDISHAKIIKTKEVPMSEAATNPRPKNSTLIRRFLPYMGLLHKEKIQVQQPLYG